MRRIASLLSVLALSACLSPSPPVVSDYNGASVKIQQVNYLGEGARTDATDAEANRICATGSKKRAEYASTTFGPGDIATHLYLCL